MESRYFCWIDASGIAVTRATKYTDDIELDAEQECQPKGAFALRTGTKSQLITMYGLSDEDFDNSI